MSGEEVAPVYLSVSHIRAQLRQVQEGSVMHSALTDALTFYERQEGRDKDDDGPFNLGDFVDVGCGSIGIATLDTKQIANVAYRRGLAANLQSETEQG